MTKPLKPIGWIGDSYDVLAALPKQVQDDIGHALAWIQEGLDPPHWKPRGDIGPGVIQLMARVAGGAYRVFYVAKFADAVWVLHVFGKTTRETSKRDIQRGKAAYGALMRHLEAAARPKRDHQ